MAKRSGLRITVVLPTGQVVAESTEDPSLLDRHRTRPEIAMAIDSGAPAHDVRFSNTLQQDSLYVAVPLLRDGQPWAVVRMAMPATAVDEALGQFEQRIIVRSLIATVVILAASWLVMRRISRPLETITRGAESFGRGDLERRLPVGGSREIVSLAETLNDMAARLNSQIQAAAVERSRQEAILHSMEEGVLALDRQGTILDLNQAAAKMFSLDVEKVRGRPIHEVLRKADVLRFFEDALSGELPLQEDLVIYDKDRRLLTAYGSELVDARGQRHRRSGRLPRCEASRLCFSITKGAIGRPETNRAKPPPCSQAKILATGIFSPGRRLPPSIVSSASRITAVPPGR